MDAPTTEIAVEIVNGSAAERGLGLMACVVVKVASISFAARITNALMIKTH